MVERGHSYAGSPHSSSSLRPKQSIDYFQLSHPLLASEQHWNEISEARTRFLAKPKDFISTNVVRAEILASWKRSHSFNISPDKTWLCTSITQAEYLRVSQSYEYLTSIAKPLMCVIEDLHLNTNYIFELVALDGTSLVQLGNLSLHRHVASESIFNESTMGTNAHSLCMHHQTPYLVIGPEHYCSSLQNLIAYAVPIFDEKEQLIASLLFTRLTPDTPWSKGFRKLLSHTVGLIASIVTSIENRLRFGQALVHMHEMEDEMLELRKHTAPPLPRASSRDEAFVSPESKTPTQNKGDGDKAPVAFEDILGNSPLIARVVRLAKRFAETDENILITGESGTGKEYFAQAIHNHSHTQGPFMSINCAAIPHRLIESELFGYESGTFTGAQKGGKPGKIELAQNGTLFLDEIGDMPLELQATLLRVLENKRVMRLGGRSYKQVDFKVIAATNRDLLKLVKEQQFREDLFFRLSILVVEIPPLRDRPEDLEFFIQHYLQEQQRSCSERAKHFSPQAHECLRTYSWPGNVRQLKNAIISSCYAAQSQVIEVENLPSYLLSAPPTLPSTLGHGVMSLSKLERVAIESAMQRSDYNVSKAAQLLEISKATLYRKLKEDSPSRIDTL